MSPHWCLHMASDTPENVARFATKPDVLHSRQLAVIGLFGPDTDLRALVRMPSGRIKQVAPGNRLAQGQVIAIDRKGLLISRQGQTQRLPLLAD